MLTMHLDRGRSHLLERIASELYQKRAVRHETVCAPASWRAQKTQPLGMVAIDARGELLGRFVLAVRHQQRRYASLIRRSESGPP